MTGREDAALDLAVALSLVRGASAGTVGPTRLARRPSAPAVAFGRADTRRPGFAEAVAAARDHGYQPVVRAVGGRAVAWGHEALVADVVAPDPAPNRRMRARFVDVGTTLVDGLREAGVDARLGEVPGEYCPGAYSVNARGTTKLVGTAQRVVRGAWLLSAVVVTSGADTLRPVLADVYAALGQPFDGASVGAVRDEAPHLADEDVAVLLDEATRVLAPSASTTVPDDVRRLAIRVSADHRPTAS